MTTLTKAQLLDENITLRAQYEVLLTKYESTSDTLLDYQVRHHAHAPVRADNADIEALIARGMPRMFSNGRQVQPSAKQISYWSARLAH